MYTLLTIVHSHFAMVQKSACFPCAMSCRYMMMMMSVIPLLLVSDINLIFIYALNLFDFAWILNKGPF